MRSEALNSNKRDTVAYAKPYYLISQKLAPMLLPLLHRDYRPVTAVSEFR